MEAMINRIMKTGCLLLLASVANAQQDTVRYIGSTLSNVDYHHGQLSPAIGVHNIQVFRANREHPEWAGNNWTYNHAPSLAYWNNTFYYQYLSDPVGEHIPPGQTLLLSSKDGYSWSDPVVIFPPYKIPDGTKKEGKPEVAKDLYAVMHHRIGFYISRKNHLLALGYYGIVLEEKDGPNDGNGVGRVVREVLPGGKLGAIYFIRYNHAFNEKNTSYPFYKTAKNKDFVAACDELLATPLMMQQWVEEADRNDPLIPLKKEFKAFSFYHLPDGKVVGLWKYALTSISKDEGKTWLYNPLRAPGFVNANAKIWGQKTTDGKYATVYNPSEFRWPLAVSVSDEGLRYKNLLLVNGEISSMRYGGAYKSYGPQYVRGIQEGDGIPPDGNLWVSYSMNKEDMWVAMIPVPVRESICENAQDDFSKVKTIAALKDWNLYSPLWAPVSIEDSCLVLKDQDPFDHAKAERVIPAAKDMTAEFSIIPQQHDHGILNIEFQDGKGLPGIRLAFDTTGYISAKAGYRMRNILKYEKGKRYDIKVSIETASRSFKVWVNGESRGTYLFFAPLESIQRVVFSTGHTRRFPDADTPTDQMYDLPKAGEKDVPAAFHIRSFNTKR